VRQYSAKLLFQWRPVRSGRSRKRRVCEERIVTFASRSPEAALGKANRLAASENRVERHGDLTLHFEFIGVLQLVELVGEDPDPRVREVWWEHVERVSPSERRAQLIPRPNQLHALRKKFPRGRLRVG
jgi:hypothetical protein